MILLKLAVFYCIVDIQVSSELREYVFELNDADFEKNIKTLNPAIVIFYLNYDRLISFLETGTEVTSGQLTDQPLYFVYVDCNDSGKNTCKKYQIKNDMEIKIFHNGLNTSSYKGPFSKSLVLKYILYEDKDCFTIINNPKELNNFIKNQKGNFLIGYFQSESNLKQAYTQVANSLKHIYNFAITTNLQLCNELNNNNVIILYKPLLMNNRYEKSSILYVGKPNETDIENFIAEHKHGLVGYLTSSTQSEFSFPLTVVYFDVDLNNLQGLTYCRNKILPTAFKFRKLINFAISSKINLYENVDYPHVIIKLAKDYQEKMSMEFNINNLELFITNVLNKVEETKIEKSEDLPKNNNGNVKIIVAKHFKQQILENQANVMILIYNSKEVFDEDLLKIFEEAAALNFSESIIFAKMDISRNSVLNPLYFYANPSIFWLAHNNKKYAEVFIPDSYTSEDFHSFINKKTKKDLNKIKEIHSEF